MLAREGAEAEQPFVDAFQLGRVLVGFAQCVDQQIRGGRRLVSGAFQRFKRGFEDAGRLFVRPLERTHGLGQRLLKALAARHHV